jgi:hypothetical protein
VILEITDEEIADELFKKDLSSYATTTEAMRHKHDATSGRQLQSKKKTIKYSASSWKHKGMRLLRL